MWSACKQVIFHFSHITFWCVVLDFRTSPVRRTCLPMLQQSVAGVPPAAQPTLLEVIRTLRHTSMRSYERVPVERVVVEACLLAPITTSRPSPPCLVQVGSHVTAFVSAIICLVQGVVIKTMTYRRRLSLYTTCTRSILLTFRRRDARWYGTHTWR
jgi:hypothetical protein